MRWFYNLKIMWKLVGGFTLIAAIAAAVGGVGYWGVQAVGDSTEDLGVVRLPSVESLLKVKEGAQRIKAIQSALLNPSLSDAMRVTQFDNLAKAREEYEAAWKVYETLPKTGEEEAVWKDVRAAWQAWQNDNSEFFRLFKELEQLRVGNPYDLKTSVEASRSAHCISAQRTSEMISTKQIFEGGESHSECILGKWLSRSVIQNPELLAAVQAIEEPHQRYHNAVGKVKGLVRNDDTSAATTCYEKELLPAAQEIHKQLDRMNTVADESLKLLARCEQQAYNACLASETRSTDLLEKLVQINADIAEKAVKQGLQTGDQAKALASYASLGGVIAALALGVFLALNLSRPILKVVDVLKLVASGDFTARLEVDTKDEIGLMAQALNEAVEAIRVALLETRNVADSLATASQQLSSASEEISSGAQEQASSLEETASSLEEITSTVKQTADNAQQANQLAAGARDVAEKGGRVVDDAIKGMGEINTSSKKIADIITAIDEIAFQTNLLALNAAVEAARAGEQGRGFAVVAGEVRNLAQRSAGAAKEIKGLIQDSVRKVETGSELVNQSGKSLEEIVSSVKRVTDIVSEIAAASVEQSSGIDQVSKAVAQMDQVTQGNASQTEELSSTAENLASQAEQLQSLVARFKLEEGAQRPAATAHVTVSKTRKATNKKPAKSLPQKPQPRREAADVETAVERELELVTMGGQANGHGGFEEF